MRQFLSRLGFAAIATAGYFITVMKPELSLFASIAKLSGVEWMGWAMVVIPAFTSPTQLGNGVKAVAKVVSK